MKKHLLKLLCLLVFTVNGNARANDYKKFANEVRNEVWNWDMSVFKDYSVPEKYHNESAVVIARHQQIEATRRNRVWASAFSFRPHGGRELSYTSIDRVMIKLNDENALNEYSELSFREEAKSRGYYRSNVFKTVVGARVIKPDGMIQEIDVDEDAVTITEGKNDKEAFKKLAIKGLETGDILDYFYFEEVELEDVNISPKAFLFFSHYPTLSSSVECILGPRLTAEYRSINGAPDFEQSEDNDKNVILRVSGKDLMVVDEAQNSRWLSAYRDLPMIRLLILNNTSQLIYKPASARKVGVYKDVSYEEILRDKKCELARWSAPAFNVPAIHKKVNRVIKNYKQKEPGVTNEELAVFIYDALRFYWFESGYQSYSSMRFYISLEKILKKNKIECKVCFTTNRYGARQNEVVSSDDLSTFVSANNNELLFFFPNGYKYAGEIPSAYRGENVSAVKVEEYIPVSSNAIEGMASEFRIPESPSAENRSVIKSTVTFSEDNLMELKINRSSILSGYMKEDYQRPFVLYEEWDKQMRNQLLIHTDFWQDMEADKREKKYIEEYRTFFEDKRKEQKELFQLEFKDYHSMNSGELIDYTIKSLGATIDTPSFEFETTYTMDGFVKKAGNNFILEAGKLIGSQWVPLEKERNRSANAYLTPMSIENDISVIIPEGYTVENIENLCKSIDNELGTFQSAASFSDGVLTIRTNKIYKTDFISKDDWNILLKVIDATNEFCSQSVLLKRSE